MKKWEYFYKIFGIVLIITGVITYIIPIPGSTLLIVLGFIWLIGKKRALRFFEKNLNKKVFNSLKIKGIVKKL